MCLTFVDECAQRDQKLDVVTKMGPRQSSPVKRVLREGTVEQVEQQRSILKKVCRERTAGLETTHSNRFVTRAHSVVLRKIRQPLLIA